MLEGENDRLANPQAIRLAAALVGQDGTMRNEDGSRPTWRFFDGAVSISVSMLVAVLLGDCGSCGGLPILGYLNGLTARDDGIIIVATLLLFPTSIALYGGMTVFFAARETAKAWAEKREMKRREEGRREGRQAERERIQKELAARGMPLTPEQVSIVTGESNHDESD